MSLLQTGVAEAASYLRWVVDKRLQAIEEFALDPQGFGIGCPGIADAKTRLHRASLRGDREGEREAIADLIRAETRELWSGTSELKLLTELYRRAARRKRRKRRNELADSRRPTEHKEGLCVARRLLTRAQAIGPFDPVYESQQFTKALIDHFLYDSKRSKTRDLKAYIELSETRPAYFDALYSISHILVAGNKDFHVLLLKWWGEIACGRRSYPARKQLSAHRPLDSANFLRDVEIHFTIKALRRVGVAAQGDDVYGVDDVYGCRIVAEVLGLSVHSVTRIWKKRILEDDNLEHMLRRQLEAMSERTGLVYDTEARAKVGPLLPPGPLSGQK